MRSIEVKILCLMLSIATVIGTVSCGTDPVDGGKDNTVLVTNVTNKTSLLLTVGEEVNISASGAQMTDVLVISNGTLSHECEIIKVGSTFFKFRVPEGLESGVYTFSLKRGELTQVIFPECSLTINTTSTTVANKPALEGYTLKGMVHCAGKGVEGVLVTDGVLFTETDANGHYWLKSDKRYELVYIVLPSGYNVKTKQALPQFWKTTSTDLNYSVQEQHNFELEKVNNDKNTVLVVTDIHLAGLQKTPLDTKQFAEGWVKEATALYGNQSNVYCLNLGDFAWDAYWYDKTGSQLLFGVPQAAAQITGLPFQFWSTMGNHDHDGHAKGDNSEAVDMQASAPFRKTLGPTHISMNIGKVHYILLDNVLYKNNFPGTTADVLLGDRTYKAGFRTEIMEWVRKDLSYVSKDTPILVGMHIPICNASGSNYNGEFASASQWQEFIELFNGYKEVDFISGHTHLNRMRSIPGFGTNMYEHNIGAICAIWWNTSQYTGGTSSKKGELNLCADGAPAGYYVYDVNGTSRKWYYKAIGADKSVQFKTYDMNEVKKYFDKYQPASTFLAKGQCENTSSEGAKILSWTPEQYGYNESANTVWINVWGWENGAFASYGNWSLEVKENGNVLPYEAIYDGYCDPLSAASYDVSMLANKGGLSSSSRSRSYIPHLFRVKASSATSTLEITVKDRFGRSYKETMTRPKAFYTGDNVTPVYWNLE